MLIQITNRCYMNCPHCMQESGPRGKHMSGETFEQVMAFCRDAKPMVVNITGGEPTEHPEWLNFTREVLSLPSAKIVSIITNGAWIEDDDTRKQMAKLIKDSKGRLKVQVYSNPLYYQDHEWTVAHELQFRSIGCITSFYDPIFMQDLGRARKNCQDEVTASDHVPSCINSHLLAIQALDFPRFSRMCVQAAKFCRPLIDFDGNIHMSESWRCPAVAHVGDGATVAFQKMRQSRPCGQCRLYKNFVERFPKETELLKKQ